MNNFNFSDCRKAVNQAAFRPTAARKAEALKLLKEALDFVTNLEEVKDKPKAKKGRRKTTKKATPQQRVADRQEKAFHGKADGAVTPSKKGAKTASVEAARESAKAVSVATGAAQRAAKKAELKAEALKKEGAKLFQELGWSSEKAPEAVVQPKVDDKIASLEAKIEALTACLALQMQGEQSTSVDAVSIEDVPFQI